MTNIEKGRTLRIDPALVANAGDQSGDQTITLTVDDGSGETQVDAVTGVQINSGERTAITSLTWDTSLADVDTDHTVRLKSDDDTASTTVTVVEAEGFVVSITATNEPVREGETLTVDYSVTNEGATADEETLFLKIDELGEYPDSETVALDSGETATGTLEWATESGDAGDYTAIVESEDDSDATSVTVDEPITGDGDGTTLMVGDANNDVMREYTPNTAFTLADGYNQTASQNQSDATYAAWKPDGAKLITTDAVADMREYTLGTAFDFSTRSFVQQANYDTNGDGICASADGTTLWVSNYQSNEISEFSLSTAWDVSTQNLEQTTSFNAGPVGAEWNNDGTMLMYGEEEGTFVTWDTSTAFDIGSLTNKQTHDSVSFSNLRGFTVHPDGGTVYTWDFGTGDWREWDITGYDVTTASNPSSYSTGYTWGIAWDREAWY